MINMNEVGAFPAVAADGGFTVRFGLYLPGVRSSDGFVVRVRVIHRDDRFSPDVPTKDFDLTWRGGLHDLWETTILVERGQGHFGDRGTYLYRYQLLWRQAGAQNPAVVTEWFSDPFARATDIGRLSAFVLPPNADPFHWTDDAFKVPDLDDLVVYELQVEEFNDTFDGVLERLGYLQSLGVNCLELMPITSAKLDFDWAYGPLNYFSPNARLGGAPGLKRLVDAAHERKMALILDVVYEHVDPMFAYNCVYGDIAKTPGTPPCSSPLIHGSNKYGFGPATDFGGAFTRDYFLCANKLWLDEYHVDGFRYDEVTDWYDDPQRAAGYRGLVEDTYRHSLSIPRFLPNRGGASDREAYSRIVQCAEALGRARQILGETYSNAAWQDDLLNKAEDMIQWNYASPDFAHLLDPNFEHYPSAQTVVTAAGASVQMPVAPFQYVETHDHSPLIVFAGTSGSGVLPDGNRDLYYLTQPYAIALYTCQGVPMLWQGQELADNYNLAKDGSARVHLRRDTHWEYFYDLAGQRLVRLYRRLGRLRRAWRCLRSRESYYYYQQSLQNNQVVMYHRRAAANATCPEEVAFVLLNFGDIATVQVPFPRAGKWVEKLDEDVRAFEVSVPPSLDPPSVTVPSHYGMVFVWRDQ